MRSLQTYLTLLGYPDIDISDPIAFGSFCNNALTTINMVTHLAIDRNHLKTEAYLFFTKISSHRDFHSVDLKTLNEVYEASSPIHQQQLNKLMVQYALASVRTSAGIDYPNNESLYRHCESVLNNADNLFADNVLTFKQYLDLVITIAKVAYNPKDINAVYHLQDWTIVNKMDSVGNKLFGHLLAGIAALLILVGVSYGEKMLENAKARLNINHSIFALKNIAIPPTDTVAGRSDAPKLAILC